MNRAIAVFILASLLLSACATTGTDKSEKNRKIAQAYKKEGDVYQRQGNYTLALTKLLDAEKRLPNDPKIQNSLGLAYMGKRKYEMAVTSFKKALRLDPKYTEAANNLGAAYLRQEKWDTAIEQFQQVLKNLIYPTPHFALANIGWAYLGKQDFAKAQTYFRKALDEKPGFITAIHGLAQIYLRTGQTDRATAYLHRSLHKTPDAAVLHADLAQAYEKKGQTKQAIKTWQLVLRLAPETSSLARTAQDRLDSLLY